MWDRFGFALTATRSTIYVQLRYLIYIVVWLVQRGFLDNDVDDDLMIGSVFNPQPVGTAGANPSELAFQAPYGVTNPLPGAPLLDPNSGEITYDANTAGFFVTCVKVQAYK